MKTVKLFLLTAIFVLLFIFSTVYSTFSLGRNKDTMFQTSTLNALLEGVYDGNVSMRELKKHGNFGIGTFHGLDGEMIVLGNKIYQIKADGKVYQPAASVTTPFAMITYFESDIEKDVSNVTDIEALKNLIDPLLPSRNIIYAIKLEGTFEYIKTRSVPGQSKPYPRLAEVVKEQPEFEFEEVEGTIIGYYLPEYLSGVNMAGYHFHFLSSDKKGGGHLLQTKITSANLTIDKTFGINLSLPEKNAFYTSNISEDKKEELEEIEK